MRIRSKRTLTIQQDIIRYRYKVRKIQRQIILAFIPSSGDHDLDEVMQSIEVVPEAPK